MKSRNGIGPCAAIAARIFAMSAGFPVTAHILGGGEAAEKQFEQAAVDA